MKLLLDTHCWLWMQTAPQRFSTANRALLEDPTTELLFSAASSWEIVIKWSIGKLPLPMEPREYILSRMERQGIHALPIHHRHTLHVGSLPHHHRDPFDRILLAQAQFENVPLLTADRRLEVYRGVQLLWAR